MTQHDKKNLDHTYVAFMVRMWRVSARAQWRASAQSVHTGETVRFASIPMLLHYLHEHVSHSATDDESLTPRSDAMPNEPRDLLGAQEANHD